MSDFDKPKQSYEFTISTQSHDVALRDAQQKATEWLNEQNASGGTVTLIRVDRRVSYRRDENEWDFHFLVVER